MWKIVIITWVSWSWKTTIQDRLKEEGWYKPINFTTRKPRSNEELDDYVFITKKQFFKKLENWDFLEFTTYWWNYYWISKFDIDNRNFAIIADPIGRSQLIKYFETLWLKYHLIFLEIDEHTQKQRLINRWDNKSDIDKRLLDRKWFESTNESVIIPATHSTDFIVDYILDL